MALNKKTEKDWDKFLKRKQHSVSYETGTPDVYEEQVTGIKIGKKIIAVKKDDAGLKYKGVKEKQKRKDKIEKKASKSRKKTFRKVAKKSRKGGYTETPYGE